MSHADGNPAAPRPDVRPVVWCGSSRREVRAFRDEARREAGFQLGRLQEGKEANDWKPISMIGPGTIEIRVRTGSEHRVFVAIKFSQCIYVLHAFEKNLSRSCNGTSTSRNGATVS